MNSPTLAISCAERLWPITEHHPEQHRHTPRGRHNPPAGTASTHTKRQAQPARRNSIDTHQEAGTTRLLGSTSKDDVLVENKTCRDEAISQPILLRRTREGLIATT